MPFPIRALAALALAFSAVPVLAQDLTTAEQTAIDSAVRAELDHSKVPSAQIAVVRGGRVVLSRAWGKAAEAMPARADQPYQIASNSKQFLGILLIQLEQEGKLSLDDRVAKWLPDVTGAKDITVRQLLSHTAGLQDFWPQDYLFPTMLTATDPAGIVARWAAKPLDYVPGTRWQYSNTGYVVAGLIAEKVGGKPLWTLFDERIFRPLGIRPLPLDETNRPGFPQGYGRAALGPVRATTPPARGWLWAAGELSMSAGELARWNIARMQCELVGCRGWALQETPVVLADGTTTQYGLGVYNRVIDGRRVVDHGGAAVGFLSQNTVYPDSRAAITVLTNAEFGATTDTLTRAIAAIVLPKAAPADNGEAPRVEDARAAIAQLATGRVDPARFTGNAQFYFSPATLADYRMTLAKMGPVRKITPTRPPRLRGGFVNRIYTVEFARGTMPLSTYAEPGPAGRWEQFILSF